MSEPPTLLKALLIERHMQTHAAFCREYVKVARRMDPALTATAPGREQYQRWLAGRVRTKPHPDHCRVLERMFPGHTAQDLLRAQVLSSAQPAYYFEEIDPDVQDCLLPPRPAPTSGLLDRLWSEPGRMFEALDSTMVSDARLRGLQEVVQRLGVQVVRVPPSSLIEETLGHFREIRRLLTKKQSLAAHRELVRCAAMYATVLGEILFNEGCFPLARQWYSVARRAADECQDQYLSDIALAGSTYIPTYTPDARGVLDNVDPRLERGYSPTPAIAWLWGFKAKAHATLGDHAAFEHAIEQARRVLDDSPSNLVQPGIFSFLPEKLALYEARGWVELRDSDRATQAAQRALTLYDFTETTEPALARFERASALAQSGETPEACRIATEAILDQHTYHSVTVIARAREFDRILGPSSSTTVRDWRDVLTTTRPPQPAITAAPEDITDDD